MHQVILFSRSIVEVERSRCVVLVLGRQNASHTFITLTTSASIVLSSIRPRKLIFFGGLSPTVPWPYTLALLLIIESVLCTRTILVHALIPSLLSFLYYIHTLFILFFIVHSQIWIHSLYGYRSCSKVFYFIFISMGWHLGSWVWFSDLTWLSLISFEKKRKESNYLPEKFS